MKHKPLPVVPLILALVILIGVTISINGLLNYWISADEGIYYLVASKRFPWQVFLASLPHAHPPLFYFVIYLLLLISKNILVIKIALATLLSIGIAISTFRLGGLVGDSFYRILLLLAVSGSTSTIILTGTLRPYALLLFFLIVSLIFLARYLESSDEQDLNSYGWWISAALLTHFSAAIVALSVVCALLIQPTISENRASMRRLIWRAHIPFLWIALVLCGTSLQVVLANKVIQAPYRSWLHDLFISDATSFARAIIGTFGYLFFESMAPFFVALCIIGILSARSASQRFFASLTSTTLVIAILLAGFGLYPLGGTRHCAYLLPFLSIAVAQGILSVVTMNVRMSGMLFLSFSALISMFPRQSIDLQVKYPPRLERLLSIEEFSAGFSEIEKLSASEGIFLMDSPTYFILAPRIIGTSKSSHEDARQDLIWNKRRIVLLENIPSSITNLKEEIKSDLGLNIDELSSEKQITAIAIKEWNTPPWFSYGSTHDRGLDLESTFRSDRIGIFQVLPSSIVE